MDVVRRLQYGIADVCVASVWAHVTAFPAGLAQQEAAAAQQARTQQAAASRAHIQAFQLQQQRQLAALAAASAAASAAAAGVGGAPPLTDRSDLPSAQSSGLSSPEGSAFPHVANGARVLAGVTAGEMAPEVPSFKNWLATYSAQSAHSSITSAVSIAPPAPATPPAADAPPRVVPGDGASVPIPINMPLSGAIPEAEFWRNSLQDPVVSGFNGASPFGAIGKSPT